MFDRQKSLGKCAIGESPIGKNLGFQRKVARDGRPKFRKARDTVEAKRSKVFLGKAKSSPEKRKKKKKPKSYSGRLLTASGGRQ